MRRRNIRGEETHGKPCAVQYICHACSIGGNADLFLQDPCNLSAQKPLRLSIVIILENIELTTKRKVLKRNIYCQVNIVLFYRFIRVLRAIYGMLEASMLWYKKLRKDLEEYGFKFNPYDACVANKIVNGKQQTIRFHVDDLLSSHMDPKVNDEFFEWANKKYGTIKPLKCTRGKVHEYLGMTLDFSKKRKLK